MEDPLILASRALTETMHTQVCAWWQSLDEKRRGLVVGESMQKPVDRYGLLRHSRFCDACYRIVKEYVPHPELLLKPLPPGVIALDVARRKKKRAQ